MGILPMVVFPFLFSHDNDNSKDTGGTPVGLMGKMPMLRLDAVYYYNNRL
jgi:hypothetical protein